MYDISYIIYYILYITYYILYIIYSIFRPLRRDRRSASKPGDDHVDQPMVGHRQTNVEQTLDKLWTNFGQTLGKLSTRIWTPKVRQNRVQNRSCAALGGPKSIPGGLKSGAESKVALWITKNQSSEPALSQLFLFWASKVCSKSVQELSESAPRAPKTSPMVPPKASQGSPGTVRG